MSVFSVFSQFRSFGFSGSRSGSFPLASAAFASVPQGSAVAVGCAAGLDALCRQAFPCARVFSASAFGVGASALARRSAACVGAVVASGGLWVSFPCGVCPVGLVPSASAATCFSGSGSGSWASLCLAVGSGCSCCVVLPSGVAAPSWFGRWGFVAVGGGVWVRLVPVQSSLF